MTNAELIDKARVLLSQMVEIVTSHDLGQVSIAGEVIAIDNQTKNNMKQSFNAKRTDLIKALNAVDLK